MIDCFFTSLALLKWLWFCNPYAVAIIFVVPASLRAQPCERLFRLETLVFQYCPTGGRTANQSNSVLVKRVQILPAIVIADLVLHIVRIEPFHKIMDAVAGVVKHTAIRKTFIAVFPSEVFRRSYSGAAGAEMLGRKNRHGKMEAGVRLPLRP